MCTGGDGHEQKHVRALAVSPVKLPDMEKISLPIPEATEHTGIGRTTIYKLISARKLRPRKLGKRTLLLVEELDELVRSLPEGGPAHEQ